MVLSSARVLKPVAARYAWADNPECGLYNKEGSPAAPFRTDTWARTLPEEELAPTPPAPSPASTASP